MPDYLGEFEQIVLLAILRLDDSAYGVPIRQEIEQRAGRPVSIGALYANLGRLEAKGYITSWLSVPTPERGGRSKRYLNREGSPACSIREYFELRHTTKTLVSPVALLTRGTYLDVGPANEPVYIETVMANYAGTLQTRPQLGRWFAPSDERPHGGFPVVISDRLWQRYFQRGPKALGRTIRLEGQIYTIVGIAASDFRGVSSPLSIDGWVPLASFPLNRADFDSTNDKSGPDVTIISRLAPQVTLTQAHAEIAVFDASIRVQSGNDPRLKSDLTVNPVLGFVSHQARRNLAPLAIVLSTIGLYGVVAHSVSQRTREIGIRMALGARHADVRWMILGRALRLTAAGIAAGLLLSAAATRLLRHFLHGLSPLDPATFSAAALAWVAIAMLASYWPSRRATRVDPTIALRYE